MQRPFSSVRTVVVSWMASTWRPATRVKARRRGFDHFADADRLVARKPRDFDLARAVCAKPAYPDSTAPNRNQPVEQKDPPFSRRRSPNLPSVTSIMARSVQQNHSSSD
jgi:hypothetical protein